MTQEEKAKAYDEALERAKTLQKTCYSQAVVGWCEYLFPELKESEDEKTRKELLSVVNDLVLPDEQQSRFVAWLEKQDTKPFIKALKFANGEIERLGDENWALKERIKELKKQGKKKSIDELTQQEAMDIAVAKCFNEGEQKPAWSEEDEIKIISIIAFLKSPSLCAMDENKGIIDANIKYLKSLKQRYTWKPSDEQIRALEYIIDNTSNVSFSCNIVKELLEQLKKLRKE